MLIFIVIVNIAIALLCFGLAQRVIRFNRQVHQLNRDLNRWTVLLEDTLAQQTLALVQKRTDLRQWQLIHLKWQLQQRRIFQMAKLLKIMTIFAQRRIL